MIGLEDLSQLSVTSVCRTRVEEEFSVVSKVVNTSAREGRTLCDVLKFLIASTVIYMVWSK